MEHIFILKKKTPTTNRNIIICNNNNKKKTCQSCDITMLQTFPACIHPIEMFCCTCAVISAKTKLGFETCWSEVFISELNIFTAAVSILWLIYKVLVFWWVTLLNVMIYQRWHLCINAQKRMDPKFAQSFCFSRKKQWHLWTQQKCQPSFLTIYSTQWGVLLKIVVSYCGLNMKKIQANKPEICNSLLLPSRCAFTPTEGSDISLNCWHPTRECQSNMN